MADRDHLADHTPILVGGGQVVERGLTDDSPMTLAAEAARRAIAHAGGRDLVAAIDTISATRLFSDSMGIPPCPFGRSNNPPLSIARAIGANPAGLVYSEVGGNVPQSLIIEFARDIARGERSVVLLAGAEAIRNQRNAERSGRVLDWSENFADDDALLEDRGWGELFVTMQEIGNGLRAPMSYYGLIDQARAFASGRSVEEQRAANAQLLASLSAVASRNNYSQYPEAVSAEEILAAAPVNHQYTKRMVAQDGVNQAAALVMCSVGAARRLGIPPEHWVFLHGMAEGADHNLSEREDPAHSPVAAAVLDSAFALAGKTVADIDLIDIYSCFPCAISSTAAHLALPIDGSRTLTLTGGLPYFGGAGNNYVMHSLAEAVAQLRDNPAAYALVTSVGGLLSKHGAGIYSHQPSKVDWAAVNTSISRDSLPRRQIIEAPAGGAIVSYVVNYKAGEPVQAVVLADTADGGRFVATSAPTDSVTLAAVLAGVQVGQAIVVACGQNGALYFSLA